MKILLTFNINQLDGADKQVTIALLIENVWTIYYTVDREFWGS